MHSTKGILVLVLLLLCFSNLIIATNIGVNGSSSANCGIPLTTVNFSRIQSAINFASPGDTIYVCRNSTVGYKENVIVNKSVNIYGNESGVLVKAFSSSTPVFSITANFVNISNFAVRDSTTGSSAAGVHISGNNSKINYVNATNNRNGFFLSSTSKNELTNSIAYSNSQQGFRVESSSNNTFLNNKAYSNSQRGFYLLPSSSNNNLSNNTAYSNSQSGIHLDSSNNNVLSFNIAYSNSQRGILLSSSSNNNLSNNTAYSNSQSGIHLDSSNNNALVSNIAYSNSQHGFHFDLSNNNSLSSNTAYINSQRGFYFANFSNNTIAFNYAYNNSQSGFHFDSSDNNKLINNLALNNFFEGFFFIDSSGNNLSLNNASNNIKSPFLFDSGSTTAFIDTNFAFGAPNGIADVNISNNSAFTTKINGIFNNLTTDFLGLAFENAINVTIKTMNITDAGVVETTLCNNNGTNGTCSLITPDLNIVNITNLGTGGQISALGIFYNKTPANDSSSVYVASFVSGFWQILGQSSINTTTGFITYGPITNFSSFGVVMFTAAAPDFNVSSNLASGSVTAGDTNTTIVTVTLINGAAQQINLTQLGCPASSTCSFSPSSGNPTYTSTFTVNTTKNTAAGAYTITIIGDDGNKTRNITYVLTVNAPPTQCSDTIDNDGDAFIDYPADPGCESTTDDDEYTAPPPQSSTSSSSSATTTKTLIVSKAIICPDKLEITAKDSESFSPVSGALIKLLQTNPYAGTIRSDHTDENGKIEYTIPIFASYEIDTTRPNYPKPDSLFFVFDSSICPTPQKQETISSAPPPPPPLQQIKKEEKTTQASNLERAQILELANETKETDIVATPKIPINEGEPRTKIDLKSNARASSINLLNIFIDFIIIIFIVVAIVKTYNTFFGKKQHPLNPHINEKSFSKKHHSAYRNKK